MPHTVKFYPSGNADTCFIRLSNDRIIIYDYANMFVEDDDDDVRIDLEEQIRRDVDGAESIDVLAISHLDRDHYKGASDLFWLDHAKKYQSDDRIKIDTLWVPAAAILEADITEEGRVLRQEARHRLKAGIGIRIFSTPNALDAWLEENGIDPADRSDLITDAGKLAPEFDIDDDGIEFFVHSPFAERCDDELTVRNDSALFMQATFREGQRDTRMLLSADCPYEVLEQIVRVTRAKGNDDRLLCDINNIPHHCSYGSLAEDKGETATQPSEEIDWLYRTQSNASVLMVSTSDPIPSDDTKQPPHKQAANYYKKVAREKGGKFLVTMEEPTKFNPKPLVIKIDRFGFTHKKPVVAAASVASSSKPPRAG